MKNMIVGIGSALVDILAHETDAFLHKSGAVKGSMTLVDDAIIESILSELKTSPSIVPGGSACNTMIGIAKLGGASRFVGKRGTGSMGAFFETGLVENGVEPHLLHSPFQQRQGAFHHHAGCPAVHADISWRFFGNSA